MGQLSCSRMQNTATSRREGIEPFSSALQRKRSLRSRNLHTMRRSSINSGVVKSATNLVPLVECRKKNLRAFCFQKSRYNLPMQTSYKLSPADFDQLIAWRRDLHAHPELRYRETRT